MFVSAGESSEADRAAARPGGTGLLDTGKQRVHPGRLSPETFKEGLPAEDVFLGQLLFLEIEGDLQRKPNATKFGSIFCWFEKCLNMKNCKVSFMPNESTFHVSACTFVLFCINWKPEVTLLANNLKHILINADWSTQ